MSLLTCTGFLLLLTGCFAYDILKSVNFINKIILIFKAGDFFNGR